MGAARFSKPKGQTHKSHWPSWGLGARPGSATQCFWGELGPAQPCQAQLWNRVAPSTAGRSHGGEPAQEPVDAFRLQRMTSSHRARRAQQEGWLDQLDLLN